MANKRYSEMAENLGFPSTKKMTKQGNEGTPSKLKGEIYRSRGTKLSNGGLPMREGTANWKMPGGFTTQLRDRSWGMRIVDGLAVCVGLVKGTTKKR